MFGVDWGNPETLLLNVTNAGLGLAVVVLLAVFTIDIFREPRRAGKAGVSGVGPHGRGYSGLWHGRTGR